MYTFVATVNYPETTVDTPDLKANSVSGIIKLVTDLLMDEPEATSFVITIVKKNHETLGQAIERRGE